MNIHDRQTGHPQKSAQKNHWSKLLTKPVVFAVYFISINALNIQSVITNRMNVWKIFRASYFHLAAHNDLYQLYPKEYFDSYLYSPGFPVLFAPFSLLPNYPAYFLWNNISMLLFPVLVYRLKGFNDRQKAVVCYIALLELLTCLQGTQTNVMMGCLILLAFLSFENRKYWVAAFAIAIGFYTKVYPLAAVTLFLFYPGKIKFLLKLAAAFVIVGALPLLLINFQELCAQYKSWFAELVFDRGDNVGKISLTGLAQVYLHVSELGKSIVQIAGILFLFLPFLRIRLFNAYYYRVYFFCVLMIWVVLFNHASEIYGYAIAICGAGIWFVHQKQTTAIKISIILFLFFGTVLSIDPTPRPVISYIYHHALKTIPFTLLMLVMMYQIMTQKASFFGAAEVGGQGTISL